MSSEDEGGGGHGAPMWVLTYADMITVLMGFFVVLWTMNKKPEEKEMIAQEFVEQFGTPDSMERFLRSSRRRRGYGDPSQLEAKAKSSPRRLTGRFGSSGGVMTIRDGLRQTIGGPALFKSGSADLSQDTKAGLRWIAEELRGKRHLIEVRGYEPPAGVPPSSMFPNAHALADARTRNVIAFLVSDCELKEELIRMAIAAPIEARNLPELENFGPSFERVDVTTLESTGADYERHTSPVPTKKAR